MSKASIEETSSLHEAFKQLWNEQWQESAVSFQNMLAHDASNAEALHGLSRALMGLGQCARAVATAKEAIKFAPANPALHYALGIMLDKAKALSDAVTAYSTAVQLKPDFFQAWNNLGNTLFDLGRRNEAIECLTTAVKLSPGTSSYQANLGQILLAVGQPEAAVAHLGAALDIEERATGGRSTNFSLYAQIGAALERSCSVRLAKPVVNDKTTINLMRRLVQYYLYIDACKLAMEVCQQIVDLDPGNWSSRFARKRILPAIPSSSEAIALARRSYCEGLDDILCEAGDPTIPKTRESILSVARSDSFFYLAYHGENDRPLQEKLSLIWTRLLANIIPECLNPLPRRSNNQRLRVGFAGSHFRLSTIGRYFASWVIGLDPEKFQVLVYLIDQPIEDELTANIKSRVSHCESLAGSLDETARHLRAEKLDVLIFPELGMDTLTYVLANLRLAPIQCAAWGHPVTSGHSNIDFYFSSEWMEPNGSQEHYTETLISLPGLGTRYTPMSVTSGIERSSFGLPETGPLYFYPHSIFKIHPDCDDLVAKVLAATPDSRLIVISRENPWLTDAFMQRLLQAMARYKVNNDRVLLLRGMNHGHFLALARLCDAMLDTLYWSGGNTTLDVLTVGLPVVTLPGTFMRGRQTAGILQAIQLDELIATNSTEYVNIANRLATDTEWRLSCSRRIMAGHHILFDDWGPIRKLEEFLLASQDYDGSSK